MPARRCEHAKYCDAAVAIAIFLQVAICRVALRPADEAQKLAPIPCTSVFARQDCFGLVAEEVEKVNPNLVVHDKEGKPYSVRYDQVNAMLLNEFLEDHGRLEEQQATIADLKSTVAQQQKSFQSKLSEQEKQITDLASGLAKVSAQLESIKPAPQVVVNNP